MIMNRGNQYHCDIVGGEFHQIPEKSRSKRESEKQNESISGVVYDATLSMYLPDVSLSDIS